MYTPNKPIIDDDKIKHFQELKAIRVGTRRGVGERRYHREDIIKLITK